MKKLPETESFGNDRRGADLFWGAGQEEVGRVTGALTAFFVGYEPKPSVSAVVLGLLEFAAGMVVHFAAPYGGLKREARLLSRYFGEHAFRLAQCGHDPACMAQLERKMPQLSNADRRANDEEWAKTNADLQRCYEALMDCLQDNEVELTI